MRNLYISIIIVILFGAGLYLAVDKRDAVDATADSNQVEDVIKYSNTEYGIMFAYPKSWGSVVVKDGNHTCPEEDTYRTQDTLSIYEKEFSWNDQTLNGSNSMIRTGIRMHTIDPKNLNKCGDEFLYMIASKQVDPAILSSVLLMKVTNSQGLWGVFNTRASRLDTEGRIQSTFFQAKDSGKILVLQTYSSFIPYFDSPELKEMEKDFKGDMMNYLATGKTSKLIRNHFDQFIAVNESLKVE